MRREKAVIIAWKTRTHNQRRNRQKNKKREKDLTKLEAGH